MLEENEILELDLGEVMISKSNIYENKINFSVMDYEHSFNLDKQEVKKLIEFLQRVVEEV